MVEKDRSGVRRRKVLKATGGIAGAGVLTGCIGGGNGDDGNNEDGSDGSDNGNNGGDGGDGMTLSGEISITGSSTVFPLASAVAELFTTPESQGGAGHTDVNINVQSTGSGGGFENFFCPGESDINNASRPIKDSETQNCQSSGVEPLELVVATDALTVVINNENDWATEMTVEELAQIWGPDATEDQMWSDINSDWPDETIERFGAAETSGTFDYFTEAINGEEGAHTSAYEPTEQDNTIAQGVQSNPYAIGYFGFSYYFQNQGQLTAVAVDNGDGPVEPSLETASSGDYQPLSRPLFTYPNRGRLSEEHIAEFCRYFVEQTTNQELVANQIGYVPNTDEVQQEQMDKLEQAIEQAA